MEIYDDYSVLRENEYDYIVFEHNTVNEYTEEESSEVTDIEPEEDQWVEDNFDNIYELYQDIKNNNHLTGFFDKLNLHELISYWYYTNVEKMDMKDQYDWNTDQEQLMFKKCDTCKKFVSTYSKELVNFYNYLSYVSCYDFGSIEIFMCFVYDNTFIK